MMSTNAFKRLHRFMEDKSMQWLLATVTKGNKDIQSSNPLNTSGGKWHNMKSLTCKAYWLEFHGTLLATGLIQGCFYRCMDCIHWLSGEILDWFHWSLSLKVIDISSFPFPPSSCFQPMEFWEKARWNNFFLFPLLNTVHWPLCLLFHTGSSALEISFPEVRK